MNQNPNAVATREPEQRAIHWSELPEDKKPGGNSTEWNFYRREVGRLLEEGHENRWVLIKGEEIIDIWDKREDAFNAASRLYLMEPCLVKQILRNEPEVRVSLRVWRCLK
jgi:hypothetical protein